MTPPPTASNAPSASTGRRPSERIAHLRVVPDRQPDEQRPVDAGWADADRALATEPGPNRDPAHQAHLRRQVEESGVGAAEFARILYQNRDPHAEQWRPRGACAQNPWRARLFFPQPLYPYAEAGFDPATTDRRSQTGAAMARTGRTYQMPSTVEPYRALRIANAVELCRHVCPVYHECVGWRLRVAGADKTCIAGGLPWNTVKILLAAVRRVAAHRARWAALHRILSPTVTMDAWTAQ